MSTSSNQFRGFGRKWIGRAMMSVGRLWVGLTRMVMVDSTLTGCLGLLIGLVMFFPGVSLGVDLTYITLVIIALVAIRNT